MYFRSSIRRNPATNAIGGYYRLVETYRNAYSRVCHRTLQYLALGYRNYPFVKRKSVLHKPEINNHENHCLWSNGSG
jgi:hypothetical protein